jgi:hypothetical protein
VRRGEGARPAALASAGRCSRARAEGAARHAGGGGERGAGRSEMGAALPAVDLGVGARALQIAAGRFHTCALVLPAGGAAASRKGAVKCWGLAMYGQLGLGDQRARGAAASEMGDALPAVDLGGGQARLRENRIGAPRAPPTPFLRPASPPRARLPQWVDGRWGAGIRGVCDGGGGGWAPLLRPPLHGRRQVWPRARARAGAPAPAPARLRAGREGGAG